MEKLNLNFSGGDNVVKSICWIMSYLSWLLLVASGWASLKWLVQTPFRYDDDYNGGDDAKWGWTIWGFSALRSHKNGGIDVDPLEYSYYPLQMQVSLYYICFILALIIITGGCFVFFYKTICKKDDQVINGMMGQFSKFHFFPLLCASALFITGECVDQDLINDDGFNYDHFKKMYIAGLIFSIIGLASFVFIYIMTDLNTNDWWVLLLLKKGAFSCLIILMWYSFCYDIFYVHYYDKITSNDDPTYDPNDDSKLWDWRKGCGLAFSIIFGIGSLAFSFVFKDLVACVMNLLIYIGLTVAYFRLPSEARKLKEYNKNGDGIVDIIMLVLSVAVIVLLLIKYRENCMKS
jgi:hypothetical protein